MISAMITLLLKHKLDLNNKSTQYSQMQFIGDVLYYPYSYSMKYYINLKHVT